MQYLRVKNLEHYQHYGTRNPPWIKLYRVIMGDYDLRQVSISSRLAYIYCLILASETDNRIPNDPQFLSDRMGFPCDESVVTPLIRRGLLLASGARRLLASEEKSSSLPTTLLISHSDPTLQSNEQTIPKPKGKRPISEDERPTAKHFSFGQSLGLDVGPEWGKFKNYCLAHDKRYANFDAAFRNWLANAEAMKGKR